ncbi:hypothetical protein T08_12020 [Trichinella sp. T8]|nr:hypothetical protein T08_12020 [Trichinella sp. T8]
MLEILIVPRPAPSLYIKHVTRSLLVVWMISTRCQQIDPCSSRAGQTFLLFDFFSTALRRFVFPKRLTSEQENQQGKFDYHPSIPIHSTVECCIAQGVLIAQGMYNMTAFVIWLADESVRQTINQPISVNGKYAVDICREIDALVCGCDRGRERMGENCPSVYVHI